MACDLKARLRGDTTEGAYNARLVDLSAEGAAVETEGRFEPGDLFTMTLMLPGYPAGELRGRVMNLMSSSDPGMQRIGIEFLKVPPPMRKSLTFYLYHEIRKDFRQELSQLYPRSPSRQKTAHPKPRG